MIKTLRKHQAEAAALAAEIANGTVSGKTFTAYVTPGGGKTLMASIFANRLAAEGAIDHVMVLCPRDSLRSQMVDGFVDAELGLTERLVAGPPTRRSLFKGEQLGCVSTYQAIVDDDTANTYAGAMKRGRWLLVLDESHHLPHCDVEAKEERGWAVRVAKLVNSASVVLSMTGTLVRDDRARLAFTEYDDDRSPIVQIRYTRRDALDEQAIVNVDAMLCDGEAEYWHRFSKREHTLSTVPASEQGRALRTLLRNHKYRDAMLALAIGDFGAYRDTRNPRAQMIVIADAIEAAKSIARHIRATYPSLKTVEAHSNEPKAQEYIRRFRKGGASILVTVGMAYEGLDVPSATHLVALTNIRSRTWLEQAFSRSTRMDWGSDLPWEHQLAYLYTPDDPGMRSFLNEWIDEQDAKYADAPQPGTASVPVARGSTFRPEDGELTDINRADTMGVLGDGEQSLVKRFLLDTKLSEMARRCHMSTRDILLLAREMFGDEEAA